MLVNVFRVVKEAGDVEDVGIRPGATGSRRHGCAEEVPPFEQGENSERQGRSQLPAKRSRRGGRRQCKSACLYVNSV